MDADRPHAAVLTEAPTQALSDAPTDAPTEGLREPLSPRCRRRLRQAVIDQARLPGRRHPPVLHVGEPGAGPSHHRRLVLSEATPSDPGLRTDLVAALVDTVRRAGVDAPLVWLARSGGLEVQDVDIDWLVAVRRAGLEVRCPLTMVVVDRRGWRDPRTGLSRTWVRLRLP